nr:MAG TPA: hypothetical protein [Caudoviricetes sp.]
MIEVRRSDREIIRADPISQKDRDRAWLEYIRAAGPEAIKEAMRQDDRTV